LIEIRINKRQKLEGAGEGAYIFDK